MKTSPFTEPSPGTLCFASHEGSEIIMKIDRADAETNCFGFHVTNGGWTGRCFLHMDESLPSILFSMRRLTPREEMTAGERKRTDRRNDRLFATGLFPCYT